MTRALIRLAALFLSLTMPLCAAAAEGSMAGAWDFKIVSPQGTRTPKLMLTQTGNQLTGTFPSGLWALSNLVYMNFASNDLEGSIPDAVSQLQLLT